ncbi:hypothetical protein FOCC_FOCC006761 [Frankliniella occidentalis]|nr:hypothetical protein FOCC_FOCC006761 [Frankliniella occidentalis]
MRALYMPSKKNQQVIRFFGGAMEKTRQKIARERSAEWFRQDASPGMYYPPGNLSPMYPGAGQSPQPTPIHSPQLPGGRTPSPGDYQAPSPYGMGMGVGVYGAYSQQPYAHHAGTGHMVSTVPGNVSIPNVRSVLLGGAPNGPTNPLNGGAQSYSSVDPVPPVSGVSSYELERLELNSSELYALGPWEGNLSEQMSSNLTLSETGPSCS